jgi:hypothetical protein
MEEKMKINDANKISASEAIQSQAPSVPANPKLLTGVGSARDVFESSKPSSNLESFAAFKQGISEMNDDKKNYLQKLQDYNNAADALNEELERLVEMSEQLSAKEHGKEEEEKDPVIIGKADDGAAVKEAFRKEDDPFQLKIVKRN